MEAYRHNLFVTWRLHKNQNPLAPEERGHVVSTLQHFNSIRYELFAYVVMNDHVHALVRPFDGHRLEAILHSWKSFSATQCRRESHRAGPVWQDESFDRIVRDEDEFWKKVAYILDNPRRRWPEIRDYTWAWLAPEEAGTEARPTH